MADVIKPCQCYVVKATQFNALNFLRQDYARPDYARWINRATDQYLHPSTVSQLLRTLHKDKLSPSALRLRQDAGLRAIFSSEAERNTFAGQFNDALKSESECKEHVATAIFASRDKAQSAISSMVELGISENAFCILSQASQFFDENLLHPEGNSRLEIVTATAGGGIAGAMLGLSIVAIPGVGPLVAAGTLAASAFFSVATLSGVIGAAGGALTKVLSDFDVDSVARNFYERQIRTGGAVVSIDTRICKQDRDIITQVLLLNGGSLPSA
ncbi:hypothetical protein [Aurantiacibacter gilvus]|uniref:Uncharacterized protein n=1 Tax=Aurantiacibacter gilvus TaxID=3139141 RepID=A0ABU9IFS5_9SPHN